MTTLGVGDGGPVVELAVAVRAGFVLVARGSVAVGWIFTVGVTVSSIAVGWIFTVGLAVGSIGTSSATGLASTPTLRV